MAPEESPVRRGLPRIPGGDPWPSTASRNPTKTGVASGGSTGLTPADRSDAALAPASELNSHPEPTTSRPAAPHSDTMVAVRRGLPRTVGGEQWPEAATVPALFSTPARKRLADVDTSSVWSRTSPSSEETIASAVSSGLEPRRYGRYTFRQWVGAAVVATAVAVGLIAVAVAGARWLLSLDIVSEFVAEYSGEYPLPEGAPVGIPAWLAWQHFFNAFLLLLIIRSGWGVRSQRKPPAYWAPRRNPSAKVSLTVWFHQSLDLLWLVNGVVFIALLFLTGQWMRIVPTSWEVFPHALSAALQYASLQWPIENGWVHYNSLQQLAYFTTVFVAAPLAAVTGFRLSALWPTTFVGLTKVFPIEWARALHFPVMLYFVVFIVVHVALVLSTGALRNLNHMYAAQGSTDPEAYADNWTGFWMFVLSLMTFIAAWIAARPVVLAPIARMFGPVTAR